MSLQSLPVESMEDTSNIHFHKQQLQKMIDSRVGKRNPFVTFRKSSFFCIQSIFDTMMIFAVV